MARAAAQFTARSLRTVLKYGSLMCTSWIQAQNSTTIIEPRQVISKQCGILTSVDSNEPV